jgi:hypothetical protein
MVSTYQLCSEEHRCSITRNFNFSNAILADNLKNYEENLKRKNRWNALTWMAGHEGVHWILGPRDKVQFMGLVNAVMTLHDISI